MRTTDPEAELPDEERDALLTIAHGSVVTAGGLSLHRLLTIAIEFVLARALGPVTYGVYGLAWRIAQLAGRFVTFGTVKTIQRYVPANRDAPDSRRRVAGLAYATTAIAGVAIGVGLFLSAERIDAATLSNPLFPPTLRLFAALVALTGVVRVHAALLRAVGSARGAVAFDRVLYPGARLLGAAAGLALGYSLVGVVGAMVAVVGLLAAAGAPVVVAATGIRPTLRGSRSELRRFFDHATPAAMSSVGKIFQNRIDIVLVGLLLTATATGIYSAVLALVAVAWIPLQSFNLLLPPVASELYARGRTDALDAVYTSVTRLVVTAATPIVATQLVFGRELLSLFGSGFLPGYAPLAVYLGGVFVGSAVGATGWLLLLTDHQYARMVLDWLLAGLNVALTYLFVERFGLVGAALGTSLAISAQNAVQVLLLRRYEGLWPFDATFLRPVAAGVVMAAVMVGVRAHLGGAAAVAVGVPAGALAFAGALVALGVTPQDRLVVRTLARRYRRNVETGLSTRADP